MILSRALSFMKPWYYYYYYCKMRDGVLSIHAFRFWYVSPLVYPNF